MSRSVIRPQDLMNAAWRELRSEVGRWERDAEDVEGFDGFSRFWCPAAVFDVYWIAERINATEAALYLTSDLKLHGFKAPLPFEVSNEYMVDLAKQIRWERVATQALRAMVRDGK